MSLSGTDGVEVLLELLAADAAANPAAITALIENIDLKSLMATAAALRDQGHGSIVTYSPKVFIPLTQLCRDVCHYCTFAQPPRKGKAAFLRPEEVLKIAKAGAKAGCYEALFTLGDRPEKRYRVVREELLELGYETTIDYLVHCARLVFEETGLFPHVNPGLMTPLEMAKLREVSISQGIMLESTSLELLKKGKAHYGSPDKVPELRLQTIRDAGEARVPFTSGILIGIGETRQDRVESLLALRELHKRYGHIQEIIVQNFRPKLNTKMADVPPVSLVEHLWSIAVARLIFGPEMSIQAPPNLSKGVLEQLIDAGLNDWGGVSPVTPDHVNPEAAWPELDDLRQETAAAGKLLVERLPVYPRYVQDAKQWLDSRFSTALYHIVDTEGLPRSDDWFPGASADVPNCSKELSNPHFVSHKNSTLDTILARAVNGITPDETEIIRLFSARGGDFEAVCVAADQVRRELVGDRVTYIVNRNINYTNICYFKCQFCAFSKGKKSELLRGKPYDLDHEEIQRRTSEAWARGATEVCMQGGIHPRYTGETYLEICRAVKAAQPDIHIHAFSPLEIWQGAETLGLKVADYLAQLKQAGLGSLPGTAAEILDDEVRAVLCADKINTQQWLEVMETAHGIGLRTTATIMFGHIEKPVHWARHLIRLLDLQKRTGGFTEFVPLPFVHMQSPIFLKGKSRRGPTFRESVLMHAVARLVFHKHLVNIQASWVKLGMSGLDICLKAGVNDIGGSLMNETITRSAGAVHGQEMSPENLVSSIRANGREPQQRTTLYQIPSTERLNKGFNAPPVQVVKNSLSHRYKSDQRGLVEAAE